ncbi:hypothetical protein CALVIDRAFT_208309 [Calocera viscosa TUFC12733]|uniref:Uncharacterized protein n=1 Tax=Calocera viscosa (strain TUFC12733) TaxID=1330018 RepID=A0A167R9L2_CALVF|nr:hypothetical protein CALVIDRAFT_208309 [Calocera viscosa TUFC12733]
MTHRRLLMSAFRWIVGSQSAHDSSSSARRRACQPMVSGGTMYARRGGKHKCARVLSLMPGGFFCGTAYTSCGG